MYEHLTDPSEVIDSLICEGLTVVTWNGGEDVKILQSLLGEKIEYVKLCDVSCRRETKEDTKFMLTLSEDGEEKFCSPFHDFPEKKGCLLNLSESHMTVCQDDHGPAHDPLADCRMLMCLIRKTSVFEEIYHLF